MIALLLVAIVALLGLGRLAVQAAPVSLEIVSDGQAARITADGAERSFALPRPIVAVRPVAPIVHRREHQIDGSDATNMLTFDPVYFAAFGVSPYYRFQAFLREEWRYSVWTNLAVDDAAGRPILRVPHPIDDHDLFVPTPFRLTIDLERPEVPRALELVDDQRRTLTVEINRNDKRIRVGAQRLPDASDLASWYFPRGLAAPLATLLDLVTRALALGLGLLLAAGAIAAVVPGFVRWQPGRRTLWIALLPGLACFLAASWYVATALFDRAPHVLDAIAYTFQAKTFASGALTAAQPPVKDAFPIPFSVVYQERFFAQYPPGTAALLALGYLTHVPWLVQPLLVAGVIALIVMTANRQYGPPTALVVLVLLVSSPFVALTAGTFLSHAPALFFVSVALYAVTRYVERPTVRWSAVGAAGLGLALLTREIVIVPYGVVLAAFTVASVGRTRGRAIVADGLVAALVVGACVGLYLGYNAAVTGNPFLLPRHLFNGADVLGFGPGIGFYGEHTVASGLVNTEQQLVSLGFYLAGWPFGFSLAVMLLPLLSRRQRPWDGVYGWLAITFVGVYVAEFYHGIAFGPRYYFEALPAFVVLTARGFAVLTENVSAWLTAVGMQGAWWRARQATVLIAVALLACNALYFLPRQATLYADYTGLPGGGPRLDDTVIGQDLSGRASRLENALVVVDEWWWYTPYFAALNCPSFDCDTVFALGQDAQTRAALRAQFPDRAWYNVILWNGELTILPGAP